MHSNKPLVNNVEQNIFADFTLLLKSLLVFAGWGRIETDSEKSNELLHRYIAEKSDPDLFNYVDYISYNGSTSTNEMRRIKLIYAEMERCKTKGETLSTERKDKLLCATAGLIRGMHTYVCGNFLSFLSTF